MIIIMAALYNLIRLNQLKKIHKLFPFPHIYRLAAMETSQSIRQEILLFQTI